MDGRSGDGSQERLEVGRDELARWKRQLADLPDVRPEKVAAGRKGIESGRYECAEVIDRTIELICAEIAGD